MVCSESSGSEAREQNRQIVSWKCQQAIRHLQQLQESMSLSRWDLIQIMRGHILARHLAREHADNYKGLSKVIRTFPSSDPNQISASNWYYAATLLGFYLPQ